ncbi:unnamed protein product [Lasius platythorax]|uniref:Uncharacterized protein n=1 Tax=Lasius platythorax TaxID=488582 RepID=A0AAV2NYE1_9HYME
MRKKATIRVVYTGIGVKLDYGGELPSLTASECNDPELINSPLRLEHNPALTAGLQQVKAAPAVIKAARISDRALQPGFNTEIYFRFVSASPVIDRKAQHEANLVYEL